MSKTFNTSGVNFKKTSVGVGKSNLNSGPHAIISIQDLGLTVFIDCVQFNFDHEYTDSLI